MTTDTKNMIIGIATNKPFVLVQHTQPPTPAEEPQQRDIYPMLFAVGAITDETFTCTLYEEG